MSILSCVSSYSDFFKELIEFLLGMDKDPFIFSSTELDMISNIFECISCASFKASMLQNQPSCILKSKSFMSFLVSVKKLKPSKINNKSYKLPSERIELRILGR